MNKIFTKKLSLISFCVVVLIAMMSNSAGRGNVFGQKVTGAPGDSNLTCASSGCHSSGAFSPDAILSVRNEIGDLVNSFTPGEVYEVTLAIETTGNPSAFGFQMVALTSNNFPATEWSEIGSNIQSVQLGAANYIEHNSPSASNEFTTRWTAPEAGSGDVTFYFSANAVNGNGSPSGDGGTSSTFVLSEFTTSSNNLLEESINVFPSPATDFISISGHEGDHNYSIYNLQGIKALSSNLAKESTIDISQLNSGLYFLTIQVEDKLITKKFIKN